MIAKISVMCSVGVSAYHVTISFSAHLAAANSDSRAQEHKGHVLSAKTVRSHVTRDYNMLRQANNGRDCNNARAELCTSLC